MAKWQNRGSISCQSALQFVLQHGSVGPRNFGENHCQQSRCVACVGGNGRGISTNIARVNVIKMEILGSFYPAITAKIVDSPDKVNQFSITDKSVRFAPSQVFREKVKNTGVRLVTSKVYLAEPHPMTKKEKQKE